MTSFQPLGALRSLSSDSEKFGKSKHKVVKPILKKLSQSEKSSIDLDRGWDEQEEPYRSDVWGGDAGLYDSGATRSSGNAKDIQFGYSEASVGGGRRYHHSRSISGNSYVSVATSGSGRSSALGLGIGSRTGTTFVHPFQQTPRTATPPLSYANSLVSFSADRDCSPTITEDDDVDSYSVRGPPSGPAPTSAPGNQSVSLRNSNSNNRNSSSSSSNTGSAGTSKSKTGSSTINSNSNTISPSNNSENSNGAHPTAANQQQSRPHLTNRSTQSQPSLATDSSIRPSRPSLHSQRTSSYTDTPKSQQTPLRITTGMRSTTTPAPSSRLANVSSRSDLQSYMAEETPRSSTTRPPTLRSVASPTSPSMSPFSRTSLDGFPRLRAKSDLDTATRADHVREARKKIQAKQMAKEEKYARQEIKQRERADNKRAQEAEKRAAVLHKEREAAMRQEEREALAAAMPQKMGKHNRKISHNSSGRPSTSQRRRTFESEKGARNHYSTADATPGSDDDAARHVSFQSTRRSGMAKRKTHGAWTAFVLWLRTRLLRIGD